MSKIYDIDGTISNLKEVSEKYNLQKEDIDFFENNSYHDDDFIVVPNNDAISIYHVTLKDGKHYIGRTVNISNRIASHKKRFGDNFVSFEILHSGLLDSKLEQIEIENYRKKYGVENVLNIQDGKDIYTINSKFKLIVYSETKVQKQIQAYKYKQSVAGVTYANAAARYGQSERSIKTITKLFQVLSKNGYASDFDKVMQAFEYGMTIRPDQYEWINKATGTFYGALKQLNEFIAIESIDENESQYDPTEQKEVIDEDTGEVKIVDIEKSKNVFQVESLSKDELVNIVLKLSKEISELKKKVHCKL